MLWNLYFYVAINHFTFVQRKHDMNRTFIVIGLLWSSLFSSIVTPFAPTKWLTQIFADCNRFNKCEINEVRIELTLKRIQD